MNALSRLRDALVVRGFSVGWALIRRLPETVVRIAFRVAADVMWWRRGEGVRQYEANLRRIRPAIDEAELRATSRLAMRSYLRYWSEVFRLPVWSPERVRSSFTMLHEERMWGHLRAGKGLVVALPHMGNWDLAGAWAALVGAPVSTVAERLQPEELYDRFVAYRESLGIEIFPLTGGGDVLRHLVDRVRANRMVPLLADRDIRASGVEVKLFGETITMPPGPALLALQTGAPLVPVTEYYDGAHHYLDFGLPVTVPTSGTTRAKVADMLQQVADVFEAGIRAHPEDWHMLQPIFATDVAARRAAPRRT